MIKLVILDRDGVINFDSPNFIKNPAEWQPIPGSLEAIARLNQADIKVAVATNQSGIARGLYDEAMLKQIHLKMESALSAVQAHIDALFFCPHLDQDHCRCRKPKTGLFEQIAGHFQIDLAQAKTPCIGDSLRDLEAAFKVGGRPILVMTGNGQKTLAQLSSDLQNVEQFPDLSAAVDALLKSEASA